MFLDSLFVNNGTLQKIQCIDIYFMYTVYQKLIAGLLNT